MNRIFTLILAFLIGIILTSYASAQTTQQRTDDLIAALAKTKYKKKEKKNVSIEVYVDIKSEAVVKNDRSEYSGVYDAGGDYRLELRVAADGTAEGSGYDANYDGFNSAGKRNFTLRNARVEGALLTATKVFENGETESLEAVFSNRTEAHGRNPNEIESRSTRYGLGFIDTNGTWTNRVFLELR